MNNKKYLLSEVASCQTGPFGSQLHEHDYVDTGTPIVTVEHLGEVEFSHQNLPFVSDGDKNRLIKYTLHEGDIVFSRVGSVDRSTFVREEEDGWLFSGRCIRVRCNKQLVSPRYLSFYFRLKSFKEMMRSIAVGATMPSLNTTLMSNIALFLPELNVQNSVAKLLGSLDEKIILNNRINAELEAMAKTLYDYWFVQFDFPDTNGKPYKTSGGKMVYNPALKREIPEGWSSKKLDDVISRSGTGLNPRDNFTLGDGDNYYITIKDIEQGRIVFSEKSDRINDEAMNIINKRSDLKAGDVLFTSIEPVGVTYLLHETPSNWNINESVFTLRANKDMISPEYLFLLLSSEHLKVYCKNSSTGSIHKGIRHAVLKDYPFAYSGYELIKQFTKSIQPILEKQELVSKQNLKLTQLRDWLLPMLMNGQVTVK